MTLTFVAVFIFLSFQILASTTAFCLANAMRLLISLVQSPSADLYDPRNLKSCTCSNDSRNRWIDEIRQDHNRPPADLWRAAIRRGHTGATLRSSTTTR